MAGTKRKRFQLSSLPPEERERLVGCIKKLGGILLGTRKFSRQTTHVICGKAHEAEKYLGGCALGKWVLQKEFVEDSYKQGSWLNEEQYEWTSSVLAVGAEKRLLALYDAPRKWRMAFQNSKAGAYKNWNAIVYMQDAKMMKAYERLLEAGDGTVYKKKVSFQDPHSLPKELTHIFVETKLRRDVLHLESQGISICSPDHIPEYVIEGPKEMFATSNTLMKHNNLMNAHTPEAPTKVQEKPGVLPGQENRQAVELKSGELVVLRRGVRRSTNNCDLCVVKRLKTTAVQNSLPPFVHITSTKNPPTARNLTFPVYMSNIMESCFDEECVDLGMESVASCLSSTQAPTSKWLHIIIHQFLFKAPTQQQAFQSYRLLQNIIEVHPPTVCQKLYFEALAEPVEQNSQNVNSNESTPWHFVSKVIRTSLGENNSTEETKRMQSNANLLLNVFDNLFQHDGYSAGKRSSIVVAILWPAAYDSACQSNSEMKQFVVLCCEAARLAVTDDSKLFVCHVLLDWLSMAVALRRHDDVTGQQGCESLAQQLFMEISKSNCYEATKLFLQGCRSSWLKMRILELILDNYDKRLIPAPHKQHLNKILKLKKIVNCYFFLFPSLKSSEKANVEKQTVATRRKNRKGEGLLHVACIQNDAANVEEILKFNNVDFNETDNAGWTALHEACKRGHTQCVRKILQYHEKTNSVNLLACPDDGVTVLHDAVLNNHLPVVKLLTQAGGLDLLLAKTTSGMTALQLARSNEVSLFIAFELNKLQKKSGEIQDDTLRPLPEAYDKVLSKNKQKYYIPSAECEKYLFYVSQLVQVYLRENNVMASTGVPGNSVKCCSKCKDDVIVVENFSQHLENLEDHVKSLCGKRCLSQLCQFYMTLMRLCR